MNGCVGLLRKQGGDRDVDRAWNLAAEAPTGVLADQNDLVLRFVIRDTNTACNGGHRLYGALRRAVDVQLAVLPVGHRGSRLERLVTDRLRHEGIVEHQVGSLHDGVDIAAVTPVLRPLPPRQLTRWRGGEVFGGCGHG